MYVGIFVCMYVCIDVCMHVCMYVFTYVCVYVCTYVCIYVPRGSSMLKIGVESNRRWMCKLALDLAKVHNCVQIWTVAGGTVWPHGVRICAYRRWTSALDVARSRCIPKSSLHCFMGQLLASTLALGEYPSSGRLLRLDTLSLGVRASTGSVPWLWSLLFSECIP